MAFDSVMERNLIAALNTETVSRDLLKGLQNESAALTRFRRVTMTKNQSRMPVLATLPQAYFLSGDTGLKQTTKASWTNKYLDVAEIATIIPISEAALDDSDYDIWGEVKPLAEQAGARALDAAVFFGVDKPSLWPQAIVPAAIAAGNVVERGTGASVPEDISDLFASIESDGYEVSGAIANRGYMGHLRNARDNEGRRLDEVTTTQAYGVPITYPLRGLWPSTAETAEFIAGDFGEGIIGVRQDFTWKLLDQASLYDNQGNVVFALAQQDMVALRMVFRVAFQVANTIRYDNLTEAERYPFGVMTSPA